MTVIPDAYTKFLVSTQTQSNQGRLLKFYLTLSGPSQRWFLLNVTSLLGNVKHIFSVISTKKMRARVKQRTENTRIAVTTEILTGCSALLKYLLKPLIKTVQQSFH
jgi:hypothetical protein